MKDKIPENLDYNLIYGLKNEAREKLIRFQPNNLESASRISGVDPPDIDLIMLFLKKSKSA
jgi:tRNA uridine 5-carboxymethylaminomethyl modification enzyme